MKETVEQFLARGGQIKQIPNGMTGDRWQQKQMTREDVRDRFRDNVYKLSRSRNKS